MSGNTVTVTIPESLYHRLQLLARKTNREIAEVLLASAEATLVIESAAAALPPDLADELAAMRLFSDQALWAATESSLSLERQAP